MDRGSGADGDHSEGTVGAVGVYRLDIGLESCFFGLIDVVGVVRRGMRGGGGEEWESGEKKDGEELHDAGIFVLGILGMAGVAESVA